jgi:hypothetical protein
MQYMSAKKEILSNIDGQDAVDRRVHEARRRIQRIKRGKCLSKLQGVWQACSFHWTKSSRHFFFKLPTLVFLNSNYPLLLFSFLFLLGLVLPI